MSARILVGDCREIMAGMEPDSVDAIVTDPPYEIGFMGKWWDRAGVAFDPATWAACLRVLKPGGRLLAFGAPRTSHRIWCAIEDAGFVIEDTVMWMFGSGFPKHRSKLKPAYEPVCVARKGGVSELNIDGCRIAGAMTGTWGATQKASIGYGGTEPDGYQTEQHPAGRWPANVILDEEAAAALDEQSGERPGPGGFCDTSKPLGGHAWNTMDRRSGQQYPGETGGASRFYYVAKASRSEREHGLEGAPRQRGGGHLGQPDDKRMGRSVEEGANARERPLVANGHPTVKPVQLMRYLVRLVTPDGGVVLDPFTGSGSTGVACVEEGRAFIGCELSPEYAEIARRRIAAAQPTLFQDAGPTCAECGMPPSAAVHVDPCLNGHRFTGAA